jgi:hypothetical protein
MRNSTVANELVVIGLSGVIAVVCSPPMVVVYSPLLVIISLMAVFLLRTLHLPGSFGPGGCTVGATIMSLLNGATTGSTDSSFKERIHVYQRPQRILRRMAI